MYSRFLRHFILSLGDVLFGSNYLKALKQWEQYDQLSEGQLLQIQNDKLEEMLRYAASNVPFYKKFEYQPKKSAVQNLKHFPILTKEILRSQSNQLIAQAYSKDKLKKNMSSGSSGVQSFVYTKEKAAFYTQAINTHWYQWGGYKVGNPLLQLGMSPSRSLPKKLKDIFYRVQYENAFAPSGQDYERIYLKLKEKDIKFVLGYPSAINGLSEYMLAHDLRHPIKSVISLGDKLFPHFEENFNKSFSQPTIIDTYGCAEGCLMACKYDTPYYYISAPHVYLEIVDDDGREVDDGTLGHVLVTCLSNFAQPVLRYRLGDLAVKLPKSNYPKQKQFNYPLLERVVGRETDIVKTPNGKKLIVHSFTGIIEFYQDIKQFQIIQNELDKVTIKYITDEAIPLKETTLKEIKEKIDRLTEGTVTINFENTDKIPPSPSGKPQIVKSLLTKG